MMAELDRRTALRLGAGMASIAALGVAVMDPVPAAGIPDDDGMARNLPVWNATDHGVAADGIVDDGPAINALILAVSSAGGGTVQLPPGTMKVLGSVQMASKVALRGHGPTSTLRLAANVNGGVSSSSAPSLTSRSKT